MNFLDTNIILRHLTEDDPVKAKKCDELFRKTAQGREVLYTSTLVVTEIDAYNAILMEKKGIESIYSYDLHFDSLPPLKRLEP